jgi:hypothetical protein
MGRLEDVNEPALLTVFPPHRLLEPGDLRRDGPVLVAPGWPGLGAAAEAAARTTSQPLAGKPVRSPISNRQY